MKVPFVDLGAQYRAHRSEIDAAVAGVIAASAYIGGDYVRGFEAAFREASGTREVVGCANGTDALYIVMRMLGIGPGDEVITTAMSWISTSETITQTGARPVFVDVDDYYGIDPEKIASAVTPRTKAIIPVHLYGQPADMDAVMSVARRHGLAVVEDCAQAHAATIGDRTVGTIGVAGTYSFYPGKNLGAYGDAGAIVTDDPELARRCRRYANHGALVKHEHEVEGINSRLDGLQAAILAAKLPHLHRWTDARRRIAARYERGLQGIPQVETPRTRPGATHVYHVYVVRVRDREALREHLKSAGVETQLHYPRPLPFLPCYAALGATPAQFPRAWALHSRILSLPMYAEMSDAQVDHVCAAVRDFYSRA